MSTLLKAVHEIHDVVDETPRVTKPGVITSFNDADVSFLKANGAAVEPTDDELKLHALANPPARVKKTVAAPSAAETAETEAAEKAAAEAAEKAAANNDQIG
jgi:hypothetical protein